jgi:diacylglycerol kinase family enzyme
VRELATTLGATIQLTERARHASEFAARAVDANYELVVAVGGDGTMNEVATALVGRPAILGLIACGSGDGLGRTLGIHGSLDHMFNVLRHGHPRTIDSGIADGHPFFSVAGLGLEAEIARDFNQRTHRGFLGYVATVPTSFLRSRPQEITITAGDRSEKIMATSLAIANACQWGNNASIAPAARVDDGVLDLAAIAPTIFGAPGVMLRLFNGTLDRSPLVTFRRAARFVIERPLPGPLQTDGEVHEAGQRVEFAIRPASLRVMCPAPRA